MRFYITTDYAVRIIICLARKDKSLMAAKDIAKEMGITYAYVNKVITVLRKNKLVESVQGSGGGYRLAKKAEDISMYDIVITMEKGIYINRCLNKDGFCDSSGSNMRDCVVHGFFEYIQQNMVDALKNKRISEWV